MLWLIVRADASTAFRRPPASLEPLVCNIDDVVMRPIPRGAGTLNLLTNYAALIADPSIGTPEIRQLVIAQLCDLVAVALGATRDAAAAAEVATSLPINVPTNVRYGSERKSWVERHVLLYPQQQTLIRRVGTSALGQMRTIAAMVVVAEPWQLSSHCG